MSIRRGARQISVRILALVEYWPQNESRPNESLGLRSFTPANCFSQSTRLAAATKKPLGEALRTMKDLVLAEPGKLTKERKE